MPHQQTAVPCGWANGVDESLPHRLMVCSITRLSEPALTNCPSPEFKQHRAQHLSTRDPFAADRTSAGLTALAMARHQRLGKESLAQRLPESAFEHIAGFVQSPAGMKAGGDGRTHNW